ncbi:carbamoyltransferase C-terminal domain-containing protein [Roseomonas genomospecies 6]|uniref:Carbamoyltransferase n=1 Tax=Roseomonas genomospecies 6 TaxID=214106 RepID=A0A9W7KNP4_9PROT|nr:carbamoyltransferase C-terminal domain-containing protein [Roseomonas genomospecies 6]KAA0676212.1 carbamoyltransferase [Roseomonas genomospecies 6]
MISLGLHFGSHDASAAVVIDGRLAAMMEQERFDHRKHSSAFPKEAMDACLNLVGARLTDVDVVAYANDVELTNTHKRAFIKRAYDGAFVPPLRAQADVERTLRAHVGDRVRLFHVDHHMAHAASAFLPSPFEESAIFSVDGMGNWVSTSLCLGRGAGIAVLKRIAHPHSLGLMYGAFTQYLGFQAACDEGKTMGLAPYGKPRFLDDLRGICRYRNGELELDLDYFTFHRDTLMDEQGHPRVWYSPRVVERFGPPRVPESEIDERAADMACSVQALLEERCFELLRDLHAATGSPNVCLAGGVALNCSMNGQIRAHTPFANVFVLPAANDAGLSIGAALLASADAGVPVRREPLEHAYYGTEHGTAEIEAALRTLPETVSVRRPAKLEEEVADLLADHAIVGWYQGRMEFGPRALGHRSILANPTRADAKDIVNAKVKFREAFRPFAPVVVEEEAQRYFEYGGRQPFMLTVDMVRPECRTVIPAVTHVDGTARVQTVAPTQNPELHALLLAVKRRNGVPVLLNTSFNIRGDTIVRTPDDAVRCFLETGMNALAIGPFLLCK